ncbi:MAG: TolC family protein, partial [Pseudobdellovibrio sp.]
MKSKTLAQLLVVPLLLTGANSQAVTLDEAFKAAIEKTETLNIAKSQLRGAEAKTDQTFSGFLPTLSLKGDYLYQSEKIGTSPNNDQSDTRVNLTQSLIAGGRDHALYKSSELQQTSAEYNVAAVKSSLYADVAKSFYDLMAAKKEVENIDISIDLVQKRIVELEKFERVGKSRPIEVLAVKAQVAVLQAQKVAAIAGRRIAKNNFSDLTALDRDSDLTDNTVLPEKIDTLKDYLKTVESRPDLLSLKYLKDSADYSIDAAKSGHWPSLDLSGNYYFSHGGAPSTSQDTDEWNAALTLTFPLYAGGLVKSQVVQAEELKLQADL